MVPSIIFALGRNPGIRPRLSRITSTVANWNLCAICSTVSLSNAGVDAALAYWLLTPRHFVLDTGNTSSSPAALLCACKGRKVEMGGE